MANLNIPFLLLDKDQTPFTPQIDTLSLVPYAKYNNERDSEVRKQSESYKFRPAKSAEESSSQQVQENSQNEVVFDGEMQFEATKPSLLVAGCSLSGQIALYTSDLLESVDQYRGKNLGRLLLNIQPKLLLNPSVEKSVGALISHCMVLCPSPKILSASPFWLCTLHTDNILRLWNTNDGRCIIASPPNLLVTPASHLLTLESFPGFVFVFGSKSADLYVINVYRMSLEAHLGLGTRGFLGASFEESTNTLTVCDASGAIVVFRDQNVDSKQKWRFSEVDQKNQTSKTIVESGSRNNHINIGSTHSANTQTVTNSNIISARNNTMILPQKRDTPVIANSSTPRENYRVSSPTGIEITRHTRGTGGNSAHHRLTTESQQPQLVAASREFLTTKELLAICKNEGRLNFQFREMLRIEGMGNFEVRRLKDCKALAYNFHRGSQRSVAIVVSQDQIEQAIVDHRQNQNKVEKMVLKEFKQEDILIFADFYPTQMNKTFLVCITLKFQMLIYDLDQLQTKLIELTEEQTFVSRVNLVKPVKQFDLFKESCPTDYQQIWINDKIPTDFQSEGQFQIAQKLFFSEFKSQEEMINARLLELQKLLSQQFQTINNFKVKEENNDDDKKKQEDQFVKGTQLFNLDSQSKLLFTHVKVSNKNVLRPREVNLMLSWDLRNIFEDYMNQSQEEASSQSNQNCKISMNISSLDLYDSQSPNKPITQTSPNCLINFNVQVLKSFYNVRSYQFFYSDEKITAKAMFMDKSQPSQIIGTNYGRIFLMPLFQEQQFKVTSPVILVDKHQSSPICALYLAYQGARYQGQTDSGGHLLSSSEDGTICVTDLLSPEIQSLMHEKQQNRGYAGVTGANRRRADLFMQDRAKNVQNQRRHSITQCFTMNSYQKYERALHSTQTFENGLFSGIKHIFRLKSLPDCVAFLSRESGKPKKTRPGKLQLEIPKFYYALISEAGDVAILKMQPKSEREESKLVSELIMVPPLGEKTIGVYLDPYTQNLFMLTDETLSWRQFNLRSMSLLPRKRTFFDAINMLEIPLAIQSIVNQNEYYFKTMSVQDRSLLSYENFEQQGKKGRLLKGLGNHKCLEFLKISLRMPLVYSPQASMLREQTPTLISLLNLKENFLKFDQNQEAQKVLLRAFNHILCWESDSKQKSDLDYLIYKKQSGIAAYQDSASQFVLVANTQDLLPIMCAKIAKIKHLRDNPKEMKQNILDSNFEERKGSNTGEASLANERWPTKILGMVHPFNLHPGMDESLEEYFNINMQFLDFRQAVQGFGTSFSYLIAKEDQNYHNERDHITKVFNLLKLSRELNRLRSQQQLEMDKIVKFENVIEKLVDPQDSTLYLGRFFNSELWKTSPYMTTISTAFFLSVLVAIIEFDESEITLFTQVWLDIVHHIRHGIRFTQSCASPLSNPETISGTVLSDLMLKQDSNIASCAKDIIYKPMLCNQSDFDKKLMKEEIADWQALVLSTYDDLKRGTNSNANLDAYQDGSQSARGPPSANSSQNQGLGGQSQQVVGNIMAQSTRDYNPYLEQSEQSTAAASNSRLQDMRAKDDLSLTSQANSATSESSSMRGNRALSDFFGELEVKGLINVSYFAFYCQETTPFLGQRDLERVSKLVVILIREVVQQFQDRKDFIYLLTILLFLLQKNLKTATQNFKRKAIMEDVVRLLLFIFNYYKPPLNQKFITRVTSDQSSNSQGSAINEFHYNFNLIRPTNLELYLKLVAATTLLEIGVSFTEEFLTLIQFYATTLRPSHEHQRNVLEILRIFINGYSENLEKQLIQIVQILLRCLDPNELALRKNSHKQISAILSNMVQIFPMMAFHYKDQRLAVGTHDGPIGIYDVRTTAKWKILEGHTQNVSALCFDSKGNYVASYSALDLTLRLWKVGSTGFFSTLTSGTGRYLRQVKLRSLGSHVANPHERHESNRNHVAMEQRQAQMTDRNEIGQDEMRRQSPPISSGQTGEHSAQAGTGSGQGSQRGQVNSAVTGSASGQGVGMSSLAKISRCNLVFMKNEKDVELTREDGSKEIHQLIK